jgi:hypothetical protein
MVDRPSAAWRRPDPDEPAAPFPRADDPEATRTFTAADIAALRELLTEDAARHAALIKPPPRPVRTKPPNLGSWLAMVVIVFVIAVAVLAGFALWLYHR